MDILSSIIYGIVQGLTEFLPISSSGHLALLPKVMKIEDPGVAFDLTMHVGTAFSVIVYFRSEVWRLIKGLIEVLSFKPDSINRNGALLNFILSTVATVILVFVIKGPAENIGRSHHIIAANLCVFGVLMYAADRWGRVLDGNQMSSLHYKNSILIGICQALAVFPGVSRSGITLTISRVLGLTRQEATSYTFLLSLPIILGGFVFKVRELDGSIDILSCLVGGVVSFIVGLLTIHFFLKIVKKIGLGVFGLYRIILAVIVWLVY
jgi:undecaprenyl-diphosphatase